MLPKKGFKIGRRRSSDGGRPSQQPGQPPNNGYSPGSHGAPPPSYQYAPWQHGELHRLSGTPNVPEPHDTHMPDAPPISNSQIPGHGFNFAGQFDNHGNQNIAPGHSFSPYLQSYAGNYPGYPSVYYPGPQQPIQQLPAPFPSQPMPWLSNIRSTQNAGGSVPNIPMTANQASPPPPPMSSYDMSSPVSFVPPVHSQSGSYPSYFPPPHHNSSTNHKHSMAAAASKQAPPPKPPGTYKNDVVKDEEYARQIQAELDAEETEGEFTSSWDGDTYDSDHDSYYNFKPAIETEAMKSLDEAAKEFHDALDKSDFGLASSSAQVSPGNASASRQRDFSPSSHERPSSAVSEPISDGEEDTEEILEENEALRQFGQSIMDMDCSNCKIKLLPTRKAVLEHGKSLIKGPPEVAGTISCRGCHVKLCVGCGWITGNKAAAKRMNQIAMCCGKGRLFLIWTWLCVLDSDRTRDSKSEKSKPGSDRTPSEARRRSMPLARVPNGTGYGGLGSYGVSSYDLDTGGWGAPSLHPSMYPPGAHKHLLAARGGRRGAPSRRPPKQEDRQQMLLTRLFKDLADLLPNPWKDSNTDSNLVQMTILMLKRGKALETMAELLRNDSFDEIAKEHELYYALIQVLQIMVQNPALIPLVTGERVVYSASAGILAASLPEKEKNRKGKMENVQPLAAIISRLHCSAQRMQQRSEAAAAEFDNTEGRHMLSICAQICILHDSMQANNAINGVLSAGKGKEKAMDEPTTNNEDMKEWHRETCVDAVEDDVMQAHFHYSKELLKAGQPAKGRMKRLVTELATLQSSLPEGIFVRHGMSRLDTIKILIVGPKDTPYENGLFEFDLFCPMDYPQRPPMMLFRTTGKGMAHFNPNLYNDGKVCLSLLGTWSGPSWMPNESTLLQVLVSIQSMIFCDEPWYNEPGRESRKSEDASKRYNVEIQSLTVPFALTDWLKAASDKSSEKNDPIWHRVVEKHFKTYGQQILKTVKEWEKKAADLPERVRPRFYDMPPMPPMPPPPFQPGFPLQPGPPGWHTLKAKHIGAADKSPQSKKVKTSSSSGKIEHIPGAIHHIDSTSSESELSEISSTIDSMPTPPKQKSSSLPPKPKPKSWAEVAAGPKANPYTYVPPGMKSPPQNPNANMLAGPPPPPPPPQNPNTTMMAGPPPPPPPGYQPENVNHLFGMFGKPSHHSPAPPWKHPKAHPLPPAPVTYDDWYNSGNPQPKPPPGYHDWYMAKYGKAPPPFPTGPENGLTPKKKVHKTAGKFNPFTPKPPSPSLHSPNYFPSKGAKPPSYPPGYSPGYASDGISGSMSGSLGNKGPPKPLPPHKGDKVKSYPQPPGPPGPPPPMVHNPWLEEDSGYEASFNKQYELFGSMKNSAQNDLIEQLAMMKKLQAKMNGSAGPAKVQEQKTKPDPLLAEHKQTLLAEHKQAVQALEKLGITEKDVENFRNFGTLPATLKVEDVDALEHTRDALKHMGKVQSPEFLASLNAPWPPPPPPGHSAHDGFIDDDDTDMYSDDDVGAPSGLDGFINPFSARGRMGSLKQSVEEYEKVWKEFLGEEAD